jgi:hypothetical protein
VPCRVIANIRRVFLTPDILHFEEEHRGVPT